MVKYLEKFTPDKRNKDGRTSYCRACRRCLYETSIEQRRKYYQKNREEILKARKMDRPQNKKKYQGYDKNWNSKKVEMLLNSYIKALFIKGTGLLASDVSPEIVEVKREQLRLKRLIKQKGICDENYQEAKGRAFISV